MPSPALAGTDASRPRSRILTPSSEASSHGNNEPRSPEQRKRKRSDSVAMDHLLKPFVALKPHPPNLHVQPRVLQPLMLLPRQHLSLSCIDFHASNAETPPGRFFDAHIKILDLESRMGSVPVVLLAKSESNRVTYALERQDSGLYVVCRLGSWIDLESLAQHATAVCQDRLTHIAGPVSRGRAAPSALTTPQLHTEQKTKKAAIEAIQSLVRKRARSQSVTTFADAEPKEEPSEVAIPTLSRLPSPAPKNDGLSASPGQDIKHTTPSQTADTIFDSIRTQYFDTLYKSMGSLAYFAKGPLSRARSAFHVDLESNLDMGDLIEFLQSLILTTVQIDKKYRETIPGLVAQMKAVIDSSDEGRKRKRRAQKMKAGKDGLYPCEATHIKKWWTANKPDMEEGGSGVLAQQVKSMASMLRTRETQLQMIVILEILALSPLKAAEETGESQLPPLPGAANSRGDMAPPLPRKRSKHNLPVLVDVHADRLTIWQSTASDEQLLLEDSQVTHFADGQPQQKASPEPLKDFCVDIIVPFFSHRLPELCDSINRKLGGPVIIKPSMSRNSRRSSSKHEQKPGAVTKRPTPGKPRTLQRALSTEQQSRRSVSRGPSNMIALMRCAKTTSVPGMKRENSEPAVPRVALKGEPDLANKRSNSLSRSSSTNNLQDTRANKKAMVEAELKEAISSLRKPNRQVVVGKAIAEAAERRASVGFSAKKVRKPGRSHLGASVQVKATPVSNRFRDVFSKSESMDDLPLTGMEDAVPPSSLPSRVPSTGLRGGFREAFQNSQSPDLERIGNTPTKAERSSFICRPANEEDILPMLPSSPLMEKKTVSARELFVPGSAQKTERRASSNLNRGEDILATPVKARGEEIFATPVKFRGDGILVTPVKARVREDDTGARQDGSEATKPVSIYDKLGWDDDLDDLL